MPYKRYRHLALGGLTSIHKCKSGQEVPFEIGSALLRIIHAASSGVEEVPESLAAAGRAIKAER